MARLDDNASSVIPLLVGTIWMQNKSDVAFNGAPVIAHFEWEGVGARASGVSESGRPSNCYGGRQQLKHTRGALVMR